MEVMELLLEVRQLTSPTVFRGKLRDLNFDLVK